MPITSLTDIPLTTVFQDLPNLVTTHGLFVDVSGYGNTTIPNSIGCILLKIIIYTRSDGTMLQESRVLRKMRNLPPCNFPCTFCTSTPISDKTDTCPLCLLPCEKPCWKKETRSIVVSISPSGSITTEPEEEIIANFLENRILAQVKKYDDTHEHMQFMLDEANKKKEELRQRRSPIGKEEV